MNDVISLLKSHRSIRKFTDQPIDDDTIAEIMTAGFAAATSSNMQAATVIRVRSTDKREAIASLAGPQPYVASSAAFFVWCADLARSASVVSTDRVEPATDMAEHHIRACVDVALAAQNAAIAAESLGLGICYIGGIRNDPQQVCELLDIPDRVYPLFGFCIGWPDQDPDVKPRLPLSVTLKDDSYDTSCDAGGIAAYDEQMREYYRTRTGGTKDTSWTEDMGALLSRETRPHIREFLHARGIDKR